MRIYKAVMLPVSVCAVMALAACGTSRTDRALSGAGIGAGVGAAGSALTGGSPWTGALVGGAVGGATGALTTRDQISLD